MTFKYKGSGYYKMRNGKKAWIAGLSSCNEYLLGYDGEDLFYIKPKTQVWIKSGTIYAKGVQETPYDLIEKWVEPSTWWVGVACNKSIVQAIKEDTKEAVINKAKNFGYKLLTINKLTEGDGV